MKTPRHSETILIDDFATDLRVSSRRGATRRVNARVAIDAATRRVISISVR